MLVYFEDLLVEHLEGAISSVGTEWQKGNRMERKKTKHVNNAKKSKKNQKKNKTKKEETFLDMCMGVETQNYGDANESLKADDGRDESGLKHASGSSRSAQSRGVTQIMQSIFFLQIQQTLESTQSKTTFFCCRFITKQMVSSR